MSQTCNLTLRSKLCYFISFYYKSLLQFLYLKSSVSKDLMHAIFKRSQHLKYEQNSQVSFVLIEVSKRTEQIQIKLNILISSGYTFREKVFKKQIHFLATKHLHI